MGGQHDGARAPVGVDAARGQQVQSVGVQHQRRFAPQHEQFRQRVGGKCVRADAAAGHPGGHAPVRFQQRAGVAQHQFGLQRVAGQRRGFLGEADQHLAGARLQCSAGGQQRGARHPRAAAHHADGAEAAFMRVLPTRGEQGGQAGAVDGGADGRDEGVHWLRLRGKAAGRAPAYPL
ncbi:hypothetical protein D3C73_940040 [compost metagenome]